MTKVQCHHNAKDFHTLPLQVDGELVCYLGAPFVTCTIRVKMCQVIMFEHDCSLDVIYLVRFGSSSFWFCCHEVTHLCNYSEHVWITSAFSKFARRHTTHSHLTRCWVFGLGGMGGKQACAQRANKRSHANRLANSP